MPITTIASGVVNEDAGMLIALINPMPPYKKSFGEYTNHLVVGTDYTNGDDVVLTFAASVDVLSVKATDLVGTAKAFVIADIGGGTVGKKVTFSAVTTDLLVDIKFSV